MWSVKPETLFQIHIYIDNRITKENFYQNAENFSRGIVSYSHLGLLPNEAIHEASNKIDLSPFLELIFSSAQGMQCSHLRMTKFANLLCKHLLKLV